MTIPLSETPTVGLGQFIREGGRFKVPNHQRDYAWKEEHTKKFLDDIESALKDKEDLYFCGLMVFTKGAVPKTFQVLDGQQRLATTLMIFSAIRNWLGSYTIYQRAQTQIEERYLGDSDLGRTEIESKLELNAANNDHFRRFVIDAVPIKDIEAEIKKCKSQDRNRALLEAALYINSRIQEKAKSFESTDDARDYLLSLVNYVSDTVQIVRLVVRGDDAAYTIFETLNDRGMDLSPLDLVKNFLFSRAEKTGSRTRLTDLEERWTEMMTLLSSVKADAFLRVFWSSKHGVPEGSRLFSMFKREYSDPPKAFKASLDMRAASERYVALVDPNDLIWNAYSSAAKTSVEALSIIGATQFHPVILAALETFDKRELERLLRLFEVIAVRYQLVARGRPGRIESLGSRVAKQISEKKISTASNVFVELRELYVPDDTFELDFWSKTERESKKAVYLLKGLEHQSLLRVQDPHPNETAPSQVTLEHIMPKSLNSWWKEKLHDDPDLHNDCLYLLGNMCLLSEANRALGNKAFPDKRQSYDGSKIRTTKSLAQYDDWSRLNITKRQKHLAKLAVAEWRFQ